MPSRLARQLLPVALVIGASLIAVVLYLNRPPPKQVTIEEHPLLVDVAEVVKQDLRVNVRAQGVVSARTETSLVAEVSGKVVEVSSAFEAGGFFRSGDVLLRIDDRNYLADVARAQAAVATARSELAQEQGRSRVAYDDWVRAGKPKRSAEAQSLALREPQLAEARAKLESALADLAFTRDQLERTVIRAPYDGLVRGKSVGIGQYVNTGTQLADLFAVDYAEVRLPLPQSRLEYLNLPSPTEQRAVPVQLYTAGNGEGLQQWQARLIRTEGVIDPQRRVLFAVAAVDDPYGLDHSGSAPLRVGSFVSAQIQGRLFKDLVVLPRAVLRAGNRLWIVDQNQRLQDRAVQVLRTDGEMAYVRTGLEQGERVCLSSLAGAVNGTPIRVNQVLQTDQLQEGDVDPIPLVPEATLLPASTQPAREVPKA